MDRFGPMPDSSSYNFLSAYANSTPESSEGKHSCIYRAFIETLDAINILGLK